MIIPLMRPLMPPIEGVAEFWAFAKARQQYSNFGPMNEHVAAQLSHLLGYHCLPVTSGTAAITVALLAEGLPEGARIALPDFTHIGTLSAIVQAGMKPVLAGVDPETMQLDPAEIECAYEFGQIDGVVVVNPFGYGIDWGRWEQIIDETNMPLVYDFAGAWDFGTHPPLSAPIAYSLHATKNFGIGEGGVVCFADQNAFNEAKRLINFDIEPNRDVGSTAGFNGKMDELRASFLASALDPAHRSASHERALSKRHLVDFYRKALPGTWAPPMTGLSFPSLCVLGGLPARALEASEKGAVFRRYYPLLSKMPALEHVERLSESADDLDTCCALPRDVDAQEAQRVIEIVQEVRAACSSSSTAQ